MRPEVHGVGYQNRSVASSLVQLLTVQLFQERAMTVDETQCLVDLAATHVQTGERRAPSREWWMKEYGLLETPLPAFFKSNMPCFGSIHSSTGMCATQGAGKPCGSERYCMNCENLLRQLDLGFRFNTMINGAVNALSRAVVLWRTSGSEASFVRAEFAEHMHQCGARCVHNTSPGS
jgi:hypothetical protein